MPEREKEVCCQGGALCCGEYTSYFSFGLSFRARASCGVVNAAPPAGVLTSPPNGIPGYYKDFRYYVNHDKYGPGASPGDPDVFIGTYQSGTTILYEGDDVLSCTGTPKVDVGVAFDDRDALGTGEYYVTTGSGIDNLGTEVTEAMIQSYILGVGMSAWMAPADLPVNPGLAGSGWQVGNGQGSAYEITYRVDGALEDLGTPSDPQIIICIEGGCKDFSCGTTSSDLNDGVTPPTLGSHTVSWRGPEWQYWSNGNPGADGAGGFTPLPFERDQVWQIELDADSSGEVYDLAYICEGFPLSYGQVGLLDPPSNMGSEVG